MTIDSLINQHISLLEWCAMSTGILGVWLTLKQNVWCFPVGIVNVALYAWLFFAPGVQLYADASLQVIYIMLLIYGWIRWTRRDSRIELAVTRSSLSLSLRLLAFTILVWIIFGYLFRRFTDASLPWLDSLLTSMSLAAQYLVAKKKIENWIIWIVADAVYIPLYFYKDLPLTGILYFIFLVLAVKGWMEWKKVLTLNPGNA